MAKYNVIVKWVEEYEVEIEAESEEEAENLAINDVGCGDMFCIDSYCLSADVEKIEDDEENDK